MDIVRSRGREASGSGWGAIVAAWAALVLSVPAAADGSSNGVTILTLRWGTGRSEVGASSLGPSGAAEPAPMGPQGLAVGPSGETFVADTFNHRVLSFSPEGRPLRVITHPSIENPWVLSATSGGDLVVACAGTGRILRLTREGHLAASWDLPPDAGGPGPGFHQVGAIAIDDEGNLAVADLATASVMVMDPAGRTLARWPWEGGGMVVARGRGRVLDVTVDTRGPTGLSHALRLRGLDGTLRTIPLDLGCAMGPVRLVGIDGDSRVYLTVAGSDSGEVLSVVRVDVRARTRAVVGHLPWVDVEDGVKVLRDGRIVWLEHDAAEAPSGAAVVVRR